jgi:hypothetical protein
VSNYQGPPKTMADFKKRVVTELGLTIERRGGSGHLNLVRADGVVVARCTSTPGPPRVILNEWKRVVRRASQEAGGRWTK